MIHSGNQNPEPVACEKCKNERQWKYVEQCFIQMIDGSMREIVEPEWILLSCQRCRYMDMFLKKMNIPKRFREKTFADYELYNDEQKNIYTYLKEYSDNIKDNIWNGVSLLFLGGHGTGKNMLCCAMVHEYIYDCISWCLLKDYKPYLKHKILYTTLQKIVGKIRDTYKNNKKQSDVQDRYIDFYDLLIIDEINVTTGGRDEYPALFEILNTRYSERKATILISNLAFEQLQIELTDRIIDRFLEKPNGILGFNWQSYRTYKK